MYFPAVAAITATVPWLAVYLAEEDSEAASRDLVAVAYVCAIGLLISLAAVLDDAYALTDWFGIANEPSALRIY
jgi:hypothetical protein